LLEALGFGNHFTSRRKNARNLNQIALFDAGVTQSALKRVKLIPMRADTLGEKNFLGDKILHCPPP
jgi:hypothetical protein